jgi:hypothetical protein
LMGIKINKIIALEVLKSLVSFKSLRGSLVFWYWPLIMNVRQLLSGLYQV